MENFSAIVRDSQRGNLLIPSEGEVINVGKQDIINNFYGRGFFLPLILFFSQHFLPGIGSKLLNADAESDQHFHYFVEAAARVTVAWLV